MQCSTLVSLKVVCLSVCLSVHVCDMIVIIYASLYYICIVDSINRISGPEISWEKCQDIVSEQN